MIKDLLIQMFGNYHVSSLPYTITLDSSDGLTELVAESYTQMIDWLWLGKYLVFIVCLFLLFKLLIAGIAIIKGR